MSDIPSWETLAASAVGERIKRIAEGLRSCADAVERELDNLGRVPAPGAAGYGAIASSVQHEVLWRLANLYLDGLTTAAFEADRARVEALRGIERGQEQ